MIIPTPRMINSSVTNHGVLVSVLIAATGKTTKNISPMNEAIALITFSF